MLRGSTGKFSLVKIFDNKIWITTLNVSHVDTGKTLMSIINK